MNYSVMCFNEDWRYQFTLANNFLPHCTWIIIPAITTGRHAPLYNCVFRLNGYHNILWQYISMLRHRMLRRNNAYKEYIAHITKLTDIFKNMNREKYRLSKYFFVDLTTEIYVALIWFAGTGFLHWTKTLIIQPNATTLFIEEAFCL